MVTSNPPTFVELTWTYGEGLRIRFVHDEIPAADGTEAIAQLERIVEMVRLMGAAGREAGDLAEAEAGG